jgi:glycosyltransferase involved in cell wall biosynthesis
MSKQAPIAFVSTMGSNLWGGSEELWSLTALRLAVQGVPVSVSMSQWPSPPQIVTKLLQAGAHLQQRPSPRSVIVRAWRQLTRENRMAIVVDVERFLRTVRPALIVLSDGNVLPPVELMELCIENRWPFATLGHANYEHWWPTDDAAERLRRVLPIAVRCYFVSKSNQLLVEKHLGVALSNAEIVRNPFNVPFDAKPAWPTLEKGHDLRLACVGRLDPAVKGQDILLEALNDPLWGTRSWRLTMYGDGPSRKGLAALCERFGLRDHVVFEGHVSTVEQLWSQNHVLIMPSRREGLPLAIVEAMLCARPVVATSVGGIGEIVENGVTGFLADVPTVAGLRNALERMWAHRSDLEEMGKAASNSIRAIVPSDPISVFSRELQQLVL